MADKNLKVGVEFNARVDNMMSGINKVLKMTDNLTNAFDNMTKAQKNAFIKDYVKHSYKMEEQAFKQTGVTEKILAQSIANEEKQNQIRLTQTNKAENDLINIWERTAANKEIIDAKSLANSIKFDENLSLSAQKAADKIATIKAQESLATLKHNNTINQIETNTQAKKLIILENGAQKEHIISLKANKQIEVDNTKSKNKLLEFEEKFNNQKELETLKSNNKIELENIRHNNRMEEKMTSGKNRILSTLGGQNAAILASYLYIFKTILSAAEKFVKMLINTLNKSFEITDNIKGQIARLDIFNESSTPTNDLYNQLVASSLRARSPVDETSNLVNNILASGVFDNDIENAPQRAINLSELVSKSLAINKLDTPQISSVLLQLSQGLAQGNLQGQELKIIRQNAPYLLKMVTEGINKLDLLGKGTEVAIGDIKELGSTGELTAEIFIEALNAMSEEINSTFANVPKTWAQSMSEVKTIFNMFISKLAETDMPLDRINKKMEQFTQWLQSPASNNFWKSIGNAANKFFSILELGFDGIINGAKWLGENLNILTDILLLLGVIATFIFQKPLAILLLIIFVFKTIIDTINKVSDAYNIVGEDTVNNSKDMVEAIKELLNTFNKLSNFISNTLTAAFAGLGSVASGVLGKIAVGLGNIMTALNMDIGASLSDWGTKALEKSESLANEGYKYLGYNNDIINVDKYKNVTDSWYRTQQTSKVDNSNIFKDFGTQLNNLINGGGYGGSSYSSGLGTTGDALNTYSKGGSVNADIKEEDIKLLKDIATKDYLINVSTMTPQMTNNFGDVRETADINVIMEELTRMMEEDLATSVVMG